MKSADENSCSFDGLMDTTTGLDELKSFQEQLDQISSHHSPDGLFQVTSPLKLMQTDGDFSESPSQDSLISAPDTGHTTRKAIPTASVTSSSMFTSLTDLAKSAKSEDDDSGIKSITVKRQPTSSNQVKKKFIITASPGVISSGVANTSTGQPIRIITGTSVQRTGSETGTGMAPALRIISPSSTIQIAGGSKLVAQGGGKFVLSPAKVLKPEGSSNPPAALRPVPNRIADEEFGKLQLSDKTKVTLKHGAALRPVPNRIADEEFGKLHLSDKTKVTLKHGVQYLKLFNRGSRKTVTVLTNTSSQKPIVPVGKHPTPLRQVAPRPGSSTSPNYVVPMRQSVGHRNIVSSSGNVLMLPLSQCSEELKRQAELAATQEGTRSGRPDWSGHVERMKDSSWSQLSGHKAALNNPGRPITSQIEKPPIRLFLSPQDMRSRKPCNCTKSQCLKLYCECFANGEFCNRCNCINCFNNLEHEEERQRSIKLCLDRNPTAFKPKIGKSTDTTGERRHTKGCHCKRSGCLKNYCECYEAKIPCGIMCKCFGCKNCEQSRDRQSLMHLADAAEVRIEQQTSLKKKISKQLANAIPIRPKPVTETGQRQPFSLLNQEVIDATVHCMMARQLEGEQLMESVPEIQMRILMEFGRCLERIIDYARYNQDGSSSIPQTL